MGKVIKICRKVRYLAPLSYKYLPRALIHYLLTFHCFRTCTVLNFITICVISSQKCILFTFKISITRESKASTLTGASNSNGCTEWLSTIKDCRADYNSDTYWRNTKSVQTGYTSSQQCATNYQNYYVCRIIIMHWLSPKQSIFFRLQRQAYHQLLILYEWWMCNEKAKTVMNV